MPHCYIDQSFLVLHSEPRSPIIDTIILIIGTLNPKPFIGIPEKRTPHWRKPRMLTSRAAQVQRSGKPSCDSQEYHSGVLKVPMDFLEL